MNRREFIRATGAAAAATWLPLPAGAAALRGSERLLVLIELQGGNDGFNTVIPYTDAEYYRLRPSVAIPRDQVLQIDGRSGLHPELLPLMDLWRAGELALVQNVGYPRPNLSHFRSIEIWDTAAGSSEYLNAGWLKEMQAHGYDGARNMMFLTDHLDLWDTTATKMVSCQFSHSR